MYLKEIESHLEHLRPIIYSRNPISLHNRMYILLIVIIPEKTKAVYSKVQNFKQKIYKVSYLSKFQERVFIKILLQSLLIWLQRKQNNFM